MAASDDYVPWSWSQPAIVHGHGNAAPAIGSSDDRNIVLTRTFASPLHKVFDTLTKPDQVPRWFQPKQMSLLTYEADLRAGGTFRYVF